MATLEDQGGLIPNRVEGSDLLSMEVLKVPKNHTGDSAILFNRSD